MLAPTSLGRGGTWKELNVSSRVDCTAYARYWPKADMRECTADVRFRGQTGHIPSIFSHDCHL